MSQRPSDNIQPAALKVLLVEDSFAVAQSFTFLMEDHGWDIIGPASTLSHAIDLIHTRDIDVAVLDINIQGKIVTPVAQLLLEKKVPFVFLSGYGNMDDMIPKPFKTCPMLLKPVDESALLQTVEQLVHPPARSVDDPA